MLTVAFESPGEAPLDPSQILARFTFCSEGSPAEYDCETGMPLLGSAPLCETWRVGGPVQRISSGDVKLSISDNYCLAAIELPVEQSQFRQVSRDAYDAIFDAIQDYQFPHIVKTWNYVPEINGGGEDDKEYYKQFCLGRGESYLEKGLTGDCMPAGTAVGVRPDQPLRVYVLSSNHSVSPLENPRQVSAFRYPREYGPQSPTFSRAVCLEADRFQQFFLSGTASIIGHKSEHIGDTKMQVDETMNNIRVLVDAANSQKTSKKFSLEGGFYRVHLKNADMVEKVLERLKDLGLGAKQLLIVQADICRRELLVELDGIFNMSSSS